MRLFLLRISNNKLYLQTCREDQEMGLGLELVDPQHKNKEEKNNKQENLTTTNSSQSAQNAQLYTYYEDLIKEFTGKYPNANDKLALALILSRGFRPTVSKNRDLALLDTDKMISIKFNSLNQEGNRMENMKLAADLTGLKNNLLVRDTVHEPQVPQPVANTQNPRGNFQIFRLIRAAQNHYLNPRRTRETNPISETDIVNNSMQRIEGQ